MEPKEHVFTVKKGVLTRYDGPGGDVAVPGGIEKIGKWSFSGHAGLASVSIPEGVAGIGECAFHDCARLERVRIPEGAAGIGSGAFYGCKCLKDVYVPASVARIGRDAFAGCTGLVIRAPAGSRAESYALENGIAFRAA